MNSNKIRQIENRIQKLEEKIVKDQEKLRAEREKLQSEIERNKLKKVDELLVYFDELNIDLSLDELVKRIKNNDLNLENYIKDQAKDR